MTKFKAVEILSDLKNTALATDGYIHWDVSMGYVQKISNAISELTAHKAKIESLKEWLKNKTYFIDAVDADIKEIIKKLEELS